MLCWWQRGRKKVVEKEKEEREEVVCVDLLVHVRCRSPSVLAGQRVNYVLVLLGGGDHLGRNRGRRRGRYCWQGKRRHDADLLSLLLLLLNWLLLLNGLLLLLLDVNLRGGGLLVGGCGCGDDLLLVLMMLLEFELELLRRHDHLVGGSSAGGHVQRLAQLLRVMCGGDGCGNLQRRAGHAPLLGHAGRNLLGGDGRGNGRYHWKLSAAWPLTNVEQLDLLARLTGIDGKGRTSPQALLTQSFHPRGNKLSNWQRKKTGSADAGLRVREHHRLCGRLSLTLPLLLLLLELLLLLLLGGICEQTCRRDRYGIAKLLLSDYVIASGTRHGHGNQQTRRLVMTTASGVVTGSCTVGRGI